MDGLCLLWHELCFFMQELWFEPAPLGSDNYVCNYVYLWTRLCFIMFYYGWTSEHDWCTPPSTRLDRTFGLGADLNQNLVQIKTEVNQGIGSREPIPGSNRFFIAICTPGPPESCQMRWTTVCHLNQLNQFEPRRNCHWARFGPDLNQNWAIFEP